MKGPAHYIEAEALIESVTSADGTVDLDVEAANIIAAAAVHATLALVAATQQSGSTWQEVL